MKLLNKISTYSLVTAGLALTLSSSPVHAQSFTFGNAAGPISGAGGSAAQRGQGFQLNVDNISGTPTKPKAVINSIKFLSTSSSDTTPTDNLTSTTIKLYIYAGATPPTLTDLNSGTTALFANDAASTTTPVLTFNDAAFTGNSVNDSRTFSFSSPIELNFGTQYYALFSENIGLRTVTSPTNAGGSDYFNSSGTLTAQTGVDSRFIVSATAVPFEFEASGGVAILGGLFLANKLRNRKQNDKTDEQS
ncbi:hypothetical protein HCU40_09410 [Pseudanabaena biceps]|nr:hypothetical protein [Pseudanabaena biceps]